MAIRSDNEEREHTQPRPTAAPVAPNATSEDAPSLHTGSVPLMPADESPLGAPGNAESTLIPALCSVCNSDCLPGASSEADAMPEGNTLCARVEYAGQLPLNQSLGGYLHSDTGLCPCGRSHGAGEQAATKNPSQLSVLQNLIQTHCTLFHDDQNRPFASFMVSGHLETWPVGSEEFKDWAARRMYLDHGQSVGDLVLKDAMSFARSHARYEGQECAVHVRVARHGESIYYDLCDRDWRQVEISKGGWRVLSTTDSPVRFRRYRNSRPQAIPVESDTLDAIRLLRKYVHVAETDLPLILAWLVTTFVPAIPHPILEMQGDMGSGKSMAQIMLARLIDPSVAEAITLPNNPAQLEQHFTQSHALVYDNVSRISDQASDMLCKAVTGGATIRRKLYTDDAEVIMEFQPVLLINGIGTVAYRPDLVQRTITIRMVEIPREERLADDMVYANFDADRPRILGAVFAILGCAMAVRPVVELKERPRMAAFMEWADAAGMCMGLDQGAIAALYAANRAEFDAEVLDSDIVAIVVRAFLEKNPGGFVGTASDLKIALEKAGMESGVLRENGAGNPAFGQGWPRDARGLSEHLNRIKVNLKAEGIEYQSDPNVRPKNKVLRWATPRD